MGLVQTHPVQFNLCYFYSYPPLLIVVAIVVHQNPSFLHTPLRIFIRAESVCGESSRKFLQYQSIILHSPQPQRIKFLKRLFLGHIRLGRPTSPIMSDLPDRHAEQAEKPTTAGTALTPNLSLEQKEEKHNSTTLKHVPERQSVSESDPTVEAGAAATDLQNKPATHQYDGEKSSHLIEEDASAGTNAAMVEKSGVVEGNEELGNEEEDQDNVTYPGGLQLGLLTFGLCMATFTVALDNTSEF
jgi:hypothetical protein